MGRREETVDEEYLAQLESGDGPSTGLRVKMPNKKINEMFAIADQILGGRRVRVICEDGQTRLARIPGKMRRREWVRENDLIVILPWDFQDAKCDVRHRYNKTQALYLSRKKAIPEVVDIFGMGDISTDDGDDELWGDGNVETPSADNQVSEIDGEVPPDVDDDGLWSSD